MSTDEQNLPSIPPGLLSGNTIAQSIAREQRDRRLEPEDMRSRRFGYNPGFVMVADPIWSGLQTQIVPAGRLVLFETASVSRQKHSVDKDDRTPPNEMVDFLAGEGLGNVFHQYGRMGFRELLPLRGLNDTQAVTLFYSIHPPLKEAVAQGVIPACIYGPRECECLVDHAFSPADFSGLTCKCGLLKAESVHQGECDYCTYACVTCRFNFLNKLTRIPDAARKSLEIVKESVTIGRAEMASVWRTAVGEVAGVKAGTNRRMALGNLTEDHLFFMRQLHERTPDDMELAKIAANAEAQANVMTKALSEQTRMLGEQLRQGAASQNNEETALLRERLRIMEEQMARLVSAQATPPEEGEST